MVKLKVGEQYRIKKGYNRWNWVFGMDKYIGRFVIISSICGGSIRIEQDGGMWQWDVNNFESVEITLFNAEKGERKNGK